MKKILLFPALLLAGAAHAQTNAVKVDIFQPIRNTLALSFEHKLSESSSFQLGLAGTFGHTEEESFFNFDSYERKTSGFSLTPEYRLYLSEKYSALEGFYAAPYVRFEYLSQTGYFDSSNNSSTPPRQYDASLSAFGLGVTVGRHWIFKERFSLDAFLGPGYTVSSASSDTPGYKASKGDFVGYYEDVNYAIRGGVTFGIAF